MYCNKIFNGVEINRIKQHLAGIKGDTESCKKVPADVQFQMHDNVVNFNQRKRKAREEMREITLNSQDQEHEVHHNREEVQEIGSSRGKGKDQGKSTSSGLSSYFMPRTTPGAQPTLKTILQSKEARERCDLAISKWIVDACLSFNVVNSVYYQPMIDVIAKNGQPHRLLGRANLKSYWKNCATIVELTEPQIRVLRILDSEEKPAMGFLYAAFHKAREEMIKRFQRRKKVIEPYLNIIDRRWDKQLYKNLLAVGFWFNPSYHYDTNEMEKHKSAISGILDVIERYAHNDRALEEKLNEGVTIFRNAEGDFGRRLALNSQDEPPTLTVEEKEALNRELTECTIEENHPVIGSYF
ncbi:uncharacterized protein G2W53_014314 [Senna tora]|uniref:Uncharacterized protein n=1 Tax=Senna tora TaxID=362788 RepID=A0A834WT84_9FABA|nr:uncharacterized protein G2W53_014314 [Senna tora]